MTLFIVAVIFIDVIIIIFDYNYMLRVPWPDTKYTLRKKWTVMVKYSLDDIVYDDDSWGLPNSLN